MSEEVYRLSWEMVAAAEMHRYCDADPRTHTGTTQTVPNAEIPDEHWHRVTRMTADPWDQYRTLSSWSRAGCEGAPGDRATLGGGRGWLSWVVR